MKAIMVMFDSLNRRMLPPYGCDWVHAPNFQRLARKTVTFTNAFVGSMPCMPARREMHTGRYNFLHRAWGPIEPFDDSMPEMLKKSGVYTHIATDHYHYWEDGGATYLHRYNTWEIARGHEGDCWKGEVKNPDIPESLGPKTRNHYVNRKYMRNEEDQPQPKTFAMGLEFLKTNHTEDNWFLTIETFDPHEPYLVPRKYQDLYPHEYNGPDFFWPRYERVTETPEQIRHCRLLNAALVSMCDAHLGKVLDAMDELDLWKDTMLIVNTDHGYLLGEHGWWAKTVQPWYNEIAHMPLFIWDPRCGRQDARCDALVQTIDLAPTLLEYFGVDRTPDMEGVALRETVASNAPVREAGLFGIHGGHVNCTDGRYVYMRGCAEPDNVPLYNYTLMPTHMRSLFGVNELREMELAEPFPFTKGCRTMRTRAHSWANLYPFGTMLFDLQTDPGQEHPIHDPEAEERMIGRLVRLMKENGSPAEQFERLGLSAHL